jgi:hypothetical protein
LEHDLTLTGWVVPLLEKEVVELAILSRSTADPVARRQDGDLADVCIFFITQGIDQPG